MTEYVDSYTEMEKSFQTCKQCGNTTGRRKEDTLFAPIKYYQDKLYEIGPLCENCYEAICDCKKCKKDIKYNELSVRSLDNSKEETKVKKPVHTIILSGPMSGFPNNNHLEFNAVASAFQAMNHIVINPAQLLIPTGSTWGERLGRRLESMRLCDEAFRDGITSVPILAQLNGWQKSRGAMIEFLTAAEWNWTIGVASHLISEFTDKEYQYD